MVWIHETSKKFTTIQFSDCTRLTGPLAFLWTVLYTILPVTTSMRYSVTAQFGFEAFLFSVTRANRLGLRYL